MIHMRGFVVCTRSITSPIVTLSALGESTLSVFPNRRSVDIRMHACVHACLEIVSIRLQTGKASSSLSVRRTGIRWATPTNGGGRHVVNRDKEEELFRFLACSFCLSREDALFDRHLVFVISIVILLHPLQGLISLSSTRSREAGGERS